MTMGDKTRLIYPIFWGIANNPVPNDKIHKLKIDPLKEPGFILPKVLFKQDLLSNCSSGISPRATVSFDSRSDSIISSFKSSLLFSSALFINFWIEK